MGLCPACQAIRGQWETSCAKCGRAFTDSGFPKKVSAGCPACAAPRKAEDEQCPACGVFYAKWKEREERKIELTASAPSVAAPKWDNSLRERPGCLSFMMWGSVLLNGAGVLLVPLLKLPPAVSTGLVIGSLLTAISAIGVLPSSASTRL